MHLCNYSKHTLTQRSHVWSALLPSNPSDSVSVSKGGYGAKDWSICTEVKHSKLKFCNLHYKFQEGKEAPAGVSCRYWVCYNGIPHFELGSSRRMVQLHLQLQQSPDKISFNLTSLTVAFIWLHPSDIVWHTWASFMLASSLTLLASPACDYLQCLCTMSP